MKCVWTRFLLRECVQQSCDINKNNVSTILQTPISVFRGKTIIDQSRMFSEKEK